MKNPLLYVLVLSTVLVIVLVTIPTIKNGISPIIQMAKEPDEPKWSLDHPELYKRGATPKLVFSLKQPTIWDSFRRMMLALTPVCNLLSLILPVFTGIGAVYAWVKR